MGEVLYFLKLFYIFTGYLPFVIRELNLFGMDEFLGLI